MRDKKIMAVPAGCFFAVTAACLAGILIGSFRDLAVSRALANKTQFGTYFATFSPVLAYSLYPAAGTCIFTGLKKKSDAYRAAAWAVLLITVFMAVYFSNSYFGKNVRPLFGYTPGESSALLSAPGWLLWLALYAWVPFVTVRVLDDSDPVRLIVTGAAILAACIAADAMMQWLKQVGSRPRYKYLLTLEDPAAGFREWWQMIPNLAGNDDNYMSWPSGHMTIVTTLFTLPLLTDCMKNRSLRKNLIAYCLVCVFILACGYNRIHMTNHFLSDVCFGTMLTYFLTAAICTAFIKMLPERKTI